jgi:hypothetical protein
MPVFTKHGYSYIWKDWLALIFSHESVALENEGVWSLHFAYSPRHAHILSKEDTL